MEYHNKEYYLEVEGKLACFTRPEMKIERVSYDVITPSTERAIFEAIFWKPAIRWNITWIMEILGEKSRTRFRNQVLTPLIEEGNIKPTIKDVPNSPKQLYQLTGKE